MSRAEAIEEFARDGWLEISTKFQSYDEMLAAVANLGDLDYLSDIHVNNLFVFPPSSKRYWARNVSVRESKLILQDKVTATRKVNRIKSQTLSSLLTGQLLVCDVLESSQRKRRAGHVRRTGHENNPPRCHYEESGTNLCG